MNNKTCGFTLIELIVILLVIGILAVILWPVTTRHPENPRRAICQSNMKNIGLGFVQYIQDANEMMPAAGVVSSARNDGWKEKLSPYLKSEQMYGCPGDTTWRETDATKATSYYFNRRLSGVSVVQVDSTGSTILLGEGEASPGDYSCTSFSVCYSSGNTKSVPEDAKLRHGEGANYAFVDGHVRWFKPNHIQSRHLSETTYGFPVRYPA